MLSLIKKLITIYDLDIFNHRRHIAGGGVGLL